jgi:hypothetical protein
MGILDLFTQVVEPSSSSDEEAEDEPPTPADVWSGLLSGQQLRKLSGGSVALSMARPGGLSASLGGSQAIEAHSDLAALSRSTQAFAPRPGLSFNHGSVSSK